MSNNEEYAPQSPDLSDYAPQSPDFSGYAPQLPGPQIDTNYPYSTHRASYDASPYFTTPSQQLPPSVLPPVAEHFPTMARAKRPQREEVDEYTPESEEATVPSRSRKAKRGGQDDSRTSAASEIEVKTKFPVARIKRIMQADEEVGKVAQVTPIAVSKALELFMIQLVSKAADEARDRSSKRVTAAHLKQAVLKDSVFDFLEDIIAKVPDPTAKKDENGDEGNGKRKKVPRRKKTETDEF